MKKTLSVVKLATGLVEFRVDDRHVMFLPASMSFEQIRLRAYQYIWDRPGIRWDIIGGVE